MEQRLFLDVTAARTMWTWARGETAYCTPLRAGLILVNIQAMNGPSLVSCCGLFPGQAAVLTWSGV